MSLYAVAVFRTALPAKTMATVSLADNVVASVCSNSLDIASTPSMVTLPPLTRRVEHGNEQIS